MEKILFIVPMHITFDSFINPDHNTRSYLKSNGKYYNSLSTDLPLGSLSMSAYIKKFTNVDVKLIDFNVELNHAKEFPYQNFFDYCHDFLSSIDFQPDIIGVSSLFSPSFNNFLDCGRASKKIWPSSLVLGGGNIPTNDYRYIYQELKCDYFDAFCFGEGEKPLKDLILSNNRKNFLHQSGSWITLKNIEKDQSFIPKHNFIEDLDEIPFFDYDLCDINRHSINPATVGFHKMKDEDKFGFHIMTSRGCPYLCAFCASHKTHGRKMRYHSVDRIKEDLTKLKKHYGAKTVVFQDDHLMSDKKRVYQILSIVGKLKLGSIYENGLTLYALDRQMLEAFFEAGVRHLALPVESGSEKVLKLQMKKPLKLKISERVAKDCRELGIYTNSYIMIGMPGETKKDIEETRYNLRKVKTNWYNISCASPLVGSEMYDLAQTKEYISETTRGADFHKAVIETEDFTSKYIQKMQYILNLELNFIYNNDIEVGDYKTALTGFKNVINVRPDHAFAHYFSAICCKKLKDYKNYEIYKDNFDIYSKTMFWKKYIKDFDLRTNL